MNISQKCQLALFSNTQYYSTNLEKLIYKSTCIIYIDFTFPAHDCVYFVECVTGCLKCPGGTCTECEAGKTYDGSKCVGMYAYWYVYVLVCMCYGRYVCRGVCVCVCIVVCRYACWYACMLVCMRVGMYVCWYVCVLVCMCVCVYVCWYVCVLHCWYVCVLVCMCLELLRQASYYIYYLLLRPTTTDLLFIMHCPLML